MTIEYRQHMPFKACKNPYLSTIKNTDSLPQQQQLIDFINKNNITDIGTAISTESHELIVDVINEGYCSLNQLKRNILQAAELADRYFYLAVNKFLIYANENLTETNTDFDLRLVEFCRQQLEQNFNLIDFAVRRDDRGQLGNFVYPVTTMLFVRYD